MVFFGRRPRGRLCWSRFDEKFRLELAAIEKGSACSPLLRPREVDEGSPQLLLIERDEFDDARDQLQEAIGGSVPSWFTTKTISHFNNFGRYLRDDERIAIHAAGHERQFVIYDRTVRKRIVLQRAPTYEDDAVATGRVAQYDSEAPMFVVRTAEGSRVACRVDPESPDLDDIKEIVGSVVGSPDLLIRVSGRGAFDSQDTLKRFVRIDEVSYAEDEALREELDMQKRLRFLGELDAGWWDGDGKSIDRDALEWVSDFLSQAVGDEDPLPRLYPTVDGMVLAEWSFPDAEVSAEFDHEDRVVHVYGVMIRSRAAREEMIRAPDELMGIVLSFGPPGMGGLRE